MFFVQPSGDVYRWRRSGCDMKGSWVSSDVSKSEVTPKAFPLSFRPGEEGVPFII